MKILIFLILLSLLTFPINELFSQDDATKHQIKIKNLKYAISKSAPISSKYIAFVVQESEQNQDLNKDGDKKDWLLHFYSKERDLVINSGLEVFSEVVTENEISVFLASEVSNNKDLNGDGDMKDLVIHIFDGQNIINTGYATFLSHISLDACVEVSPTKKVFFIVDEEAHYETDLNNDKDSYDWVLHCYDIPTQKISNSGYAIHKFIEDPVVKKPHPCELHYMTLEGDNLIFTVSEIHQKKDLNFDSDKIDKVLHIYNLNTEIIQNTKIAITNTPSAFDVDSNHIVLLVHELFENRTDFNLDNDLFDEMAHLYDIKKGEVVTNTKLASMNDEIVFGRPVGIWIEGNLGAFLVDEKRQGMQDLNGDGDGS